MRNIPHILSRDKNLALMRAVMLEEVEEVVKGMEKTRPLDQMALRQNFPKDPRSL